MGRITLGKRTPSRGKRYGATSRIRRYHVEITHMDWPRAVLHTGVSEVDSARPGWGSYTAEWAEGFCQGRHGLTKGGKPYRGRIHMWDHQRGITTHGHLARHRGWPWATYEYWTWRLVLLTAEGAGGTSTGFAVGNWTEKQQGARIRSVEGNGAASVIDTERVSSVTGHPRQVHGKTLALYGDCKTSQTY